MWPQTDLESQYWERPYTHQNKFGPHNSYTFLKTDKKTVIAKAMKIGFTEDGDLEI